MTPGPASSLAPGPGRGRWPGATAPAGSPPPPGEGRPASQGPGPNGLTLPGPRGPRRQQPGRIRRRRDWQGLGSPGPTLQRPWRTGIGRIGSRRQGPQAQLAALARRRAGTEGAEDGPAHPGGPLDSLAGQIRSQPGKTPAENCLGPPAAESRNRPLPGGVDRPDQEPARHPGAGWGRGSGRLACQHLNQPGGLDQLGALERRCSRGRRWRQRSPDPAPERVLDRVPD